MCKVTPRGVQCRKRTAWVFAALLLFMTATTAAVQPEQHINIDNVVVINSYGMTAPFLISWTHVWVFVAFGGLGSTFFKIPEVDEHFRYLALAKPFLGLCGGMSFCLLMTDGSDPPAVGLAAYGFFAALFSAPFLQILLAVMMIPKNQAGLLNSINPFKFKIVVDDKGHNNADNK